MLAQPPPFGLGKPRVMKQRAKTGDQAVETAPPPSEDVPRYFNRELSWLAFNRRVLEEASNAAHPLLERLRFLSISATNLDEFFMVRVAGLKAHQALGIEKVSNEGLTSSQQLTAVRAAVDLLVGDQQQVWLQLQEALIAVGVDVVEMEPLDAATESWLDKYFREQIFPLLTPQAIDPAHPFPFIPNRGFSLIFEIRKGKAEPVHQLIMRRPHSTSASRTTSFSNSSVSIIRRRYCDRTFSGSSRPLSSAALPLMWRCSWTPSAPTGSSRLSRSQFPTSVSACWIGETGDAPFIAPGPAIRARASSGVNFRPRRSSCSSSSADFSFSGIAPPFAAQLTPTRSSRAAST